MSNNDSFIDEVNEELARDRLFGLMRRYAWVAVLVVLAAVGGAAFNEWRKAQETARAQAFGDAIVAALDGEDYAAQAQALSQIDAQGDRAGILNLLRAASALQGDDRDAALVALAAVEADATLPASYRQIATLKRVIVGGAALPLDERQAALTALAAPGQPFRPLALEQLALLEIERGNLDAAADQARALLEEPDVTPTLRQRVEQLIIVLGGDIAQG